MFLLTIPLIAVGPSFAQAKPLRVLILGDSLCYMPKTPENPELPAILKSLLIDVGVKADVDSVLKGGHTFEMHLQEGDFQKKLNEKPYDFVILQPYSIEAIDLPACFEKENLGPKGFKNFYENGEKAISLVQEHHAVPLLFETWAYDTGHVWLQPNFQCLKYSAADSQTWFGGSLSAFNEKLSVGFSKLGHAENTEILPIGQVWWQVRKAGSTVVPVAALYQADHFHPSYLGSYLSAVFIASRLSGKPASAFHYRPAEVSEAQARFLRGTVQQFNAVSALKAGSGG